MWQTRKWASVAIIAAVLMIGAGMGGRAAQDEQTPGRSRHRTPEAPAPQTRGARPPDQRLAFRQADAGIRRQHWCGIRTIADTLVFAGTTTCTARTSPRRERLLAFHFRSRTPSRRGSFARWEYVATAKGVQGVKLRDAATGRRRGPLAQRQTSHPPRRVQPDSTRLVALGSGGDPCPITGHVARLGATREREETMRPRSPSGTSGDPQGTGPSGGIHNPRPVATIG